MMRKKEGFTTIELLVSFVIVGAITISMFSVIMNYRNSQQLASFKNDMITYKNKITKLIQDDILNKRLIGIDYYGQMIYLTLETDEKEEIKQIVVSKNSIEYDGITYPLEVDGAEITVDKISYRSVDNAFEIYIPIEHIDLSKDYGIRINGFLIPSEPE